MKEDIKKNQFIKKNTKKNKILTFNKECDHLRRFFFIHTIYINDLHILYLDV